MSLSSDACCDLRHGSPYVPPPGVAGLKVLFLKGLSDSKKVTVTQMFPRGRVSYYCPGIIGLDAHWHHVPANNRQTVFLANQSLDFEVPHVCVNCICESDGMEGALKLAAALVSQVKKEQPVLVINDPLRIAGTRRDRIFESFCELKGFVIPKVLRFIPRRVQDVVDKVRSGEIRQPFLIRPAGTHTGDSLVRIDDVVRDRDLLERFAFDGRAFYLTEFVDYASADGLYRKCRILVVNGEPYARHFIVGKEWMIHSHSRYDIMPHSASLLEEEERFLGAFPAQLNANVQQGIRRIHEVLGLDYFGIDCHVYESGNILVFEINAAMKGLEQARLDENPYLGPHLARIREAIERMVVERGLAYV